MTDEIKNLLQDYMEAAVNLYGIIPLRKFLEIYNTQNEPVTEQELKELTDSINFDERHYDIIGEDEVYKTAEKTDFLDKTLTSEYLYCMGDWDDYIEMCDMQEGIDYYIPKRERFLRYKEEYFFEKSLEFIDVRAFLRNLPYLNQKDADDIAEEMQLELEMELGNDITHAVNGAVRLGLNPDDEAGLRTFCELLMNMNDGVRKHCYRGHTRKEIFSNIF